jgi:hypothetical protein
MFCLLFYLLRQDQRGRAAAVWGIPLCFAVWVNLHGGWIVGLGVLGVWMASDAWHRWNTRRTLVLVQVGVLTVFATLLNPYGYGLWQFLAETIRFERPDITDWLPLFELPVSILVIESVLPLVAIVALWRQRLLSSVPFRDLAVLAVLMVATVRLGRIDAFLQSAIAIVLAAPLLALLNGIDLTERGVFRRPSLPVGVVAVALITCVGVTVFENVSVVRVRGHWVPDRAAAMFLRETRPGARVLTWFDWGEYALWQLSPADIRISMDGRRETVYSQRVLDDHHRFYLGNADMVDYPDRIGADHVWLPANFPIIELLVQHGWTRVLSTGKSVVLARGGAPVHPGAIPSRTDDADIFPWP